MLITKALIVADPWIGFILNGSKTWEMRANQTSHRGWFGLIRKGSGAIYGLARLVEVGPPLTQSEMLGAIEKHCIPADLILSGEVANGRRLGVWTMCTSSKSLCPMPTRAALSHGLRLTTKPPELWPLRSRMGWVATGFLKTLVLTPARGLQRQWRRLCQVERSNAHGPARPSVLAKRAGPS